MDQNIQKQLGLIAQSNRWIRASLDGEKQKNAYRNMVHCRRKLNKKKFALESNPAVALYGESQVGKSYLISSLLSEEHKPFGITDASGAVYNFIEDINPIGGGNESTSLVSRFSVSYQPIHADFPIKATLLSPADIVLALCDSYYNDIKAAHSLIWQTEQINTEIHLLKERFLDGQPQQNVFCEDDVLDMQDYFRENFSTKASNVLFSVFFEEVSLFVAKVKPSEWKAVFSLLWNNNPKFTLLFDTLISVYEKIGFSATVYLPIEAVLRRHGTLLDVERLKAIYNPSGHIVSAYTSETTVLFMENGQERRVSSKKSHLCALLAELVFHQEESLLQSKPFLKETDLLDFPGARGRLTLPENEINDENIPELLIRGKVAYLFNKYSETEKISIFMLCAKHEQAAQRAMPEMLNNWIHKFIGETPEKREAFIATSQIPPLFIVGTFFNVNLEYNPLQDKPNDSSSLDYRWHQRFERTLSVELLNTETYSWFNDWTKTSPNFQNIFLLRDFVYSASKSQLFKGFLDGGRETEEIIPENYPDFRRDLRRSFIEHHFVKRHFVNPAESWDEAASMNKDGSQLIIDKLTIAANNINQARYEKTVSELNDISEAVLSELRKYHHSNDKDEELQKAKAIAGDIQYKLDTAFRADGIKQYGLLMKEFMLDEGLVLELYRKKINDIEHQDVVHLDVYSSYRIHVPVMDGDTTDSYFERLCAHYEKATEEQKQRFRTALDHQGVDLEELVSGNSDLIKNNAQQLAETLLEYWFAHITSADKRTIQQILVQGGSPVLQEITDMYRKLFKKAAIAEKIAGKIRRFIDGQSKTDLPYEIMADMSAELLNKCIHTVGFDYLDEAEINDLREANEQNKLGLILDQNNNPTEKSVAELFERIENWTDIIKSNPEEMKSLPSYRNYLSWYNRLKVGFVSVCDIPSYDVQANEKLGAIIKETETITYA